MGSLKWAGMVTSSRDGSALRRAAESACGVLRTTERKHCLHTPPVDRSHTATCREHPAIIIIIIIVVVDVVITITIITSIPTTIIIILILTTHLVVSGGDEEEGAWEVAVGGLLREARRGGQAVDGPVARVTPHLTGLKDSEIQIYDPEVSGGAYGR
jgi:hypothetical protein